MKLSDIITPEKFRQLATYITICDEDDLLKFADALEEMEAKNISSNPVLSVSLPLVDFEAVQSELNKSFDNIRMGAEHTLYLNERFEVRKRQ